MVNCVYGISIDGFIFSENGRVKEWRWVFQTEAACYDEVGGDLDVSEGGFEDKSARRCLDSFDSPEEADLVVGLGGPSFFREPWRYQGYQYEDSQPSGKKALQKQP